MHFQFFIPILIQLSRAKFELKWIPYGKVEGKGFLEGYIEVMARAVAVGSMQSVT